MADDCDSEYLFQHRLCDFGRQRLSLDRGWRFSAGDIPFPIVRGHNDSYRSTKAGCASGAASKDFDDTQWRVLNLPHDWAVEGPFKAEENISQGYRPRGIGWYRRHFSLPASDRRRHLELQFDGVATNCTVWVNGVIAHRNWCGYTAFSIDITPIARFGDESNCIAIRVDAIAMDGWWYEGAGIYRHAWLMKRERVHVVTDGLYMNPVRDEIGRWSVPSEITLANCGTEPENVSLNILVIDQMGNTVAKACVDSTVAALCEVVVVSRIEIHDPRLWTIDDPALYGVEVEILLNGVKVDVVKSKCGFRTLRFNSEEGFFLNDIPLKIKGVCCHQDHAGVGVAVPDAIWEFRLQRLKEMGANAYRCSHNPPSPELLDLCDRLGFLVMNENRHFNTSPEYMRQLEWLIRRDRNHPSVFLWSIFNEEPMQGTRAGFECARRMVGLVKQLDSTRPVTAGINSGLFVPINASQAIDVLGINYQSDDYDRIHRLNPDVALISSEDTSGFMTRGEIQTDVSSNIVSANDTERAPWGNTHRDGWKAIATRRFLCGGFVWTGFDYRGEPTPYHWPSTGSFFGCMDLCGFPKTAFYIHRAHWVEKQPVLHLVPHWNWPNREGQIVRVMACSNAEAVSLYLNGKLLSEKAVDPYDMVTWEVPYVPGRLEAIARRDGKEIARTSVETAGPPHSLRIVSERLTLLGDGVDSLPLTVEVVDEFGRPVPNSSISVKLVIEGPGSILGHGNGNPNSHELENGSDRTLFNGLAQVIVRSDFNVTGTLVLRAESKEFNPAEVSIDVRTADARPYVPEQKPTLLLERWRMSPATTSRPDPKQEVSNQDMNTWAQVAVGNLQSLGSSFYVIYHATFLPFRIFQENGGVIVFRSITGTAEVWLDNELVAKKSGAKCGSLTVLLLPRLGERTISVLVHSRSGGSAGLSSSVFVKGLEPDLNDKAMAQDISVPVSLNPI